jgi:hypothetical protein
MPIEAITCRSLTDDDVHGLLLDLVGVQPQQTDGSILHGLRVGADRDREVTGDIDADVLDRQCAFQGHLDLHRLQVQVAVILHQRPDEVGPAVDALRRVAAADPAVLDQDAVARTALVAADQQHEETEQHDRGQHDADHHPRDVLQGQPGASWGRSEQQAVKHEVYSRVGGGNDFDGVGPRTPDYYLRSRRQIIVGRHRLIFDGTVLKVQVDLATPALRAGMFR